MVTYETVFWSVLVEFLPSRIHVSALLLMFGNTRLEIADERYPFLFTDAASFFPAPPLLWKIACT